MKYLRLLIFLTPFLSSCSIPITCVLYNNTSEVVTILQIENSIVKESFVIEQADSISISEWRYYSYKIVSKNNIWKFGLPTMHIPNVEFVETINYGFWVKRIVYAQLENNGVIYLIQKNQEFPAAIFGKQPKGYPLKPTR